MHIKHLENCTVILPLVEQDDPKAGVTLFPQIVVYPDDRTVYIYGLGYQELEIDVDRITKIGEAFRKAAEMMGCTVTEINNDKDV